ncbi:MULTISPECIES: uroporphyrinogen-III C-methyltransferase [unclassified Modicisalibacter]|uniref:uroporphyrinogen-III C-methyltransferase n=1 Tax=unclassified Modicisalibacter TaxID=2679913 RepID=UPI001CCD86A5|nr:MULTISPECIES: uroporphyrinogen-III C-methyltransferase [unclassified Modicisalibacter]MBZ9559968.1 uroporphyrinogen-III C-methyltransferase [Modicisalibacter sp. R2A 31.J]MBZ9575877.1 uroporphyrinogen-III C-methyltransferase [Modicisalibacter sp. MOD 31.J]
MLPTVKPWQAKRCERPGLLARLTEGASRTLSRIVGPGRATGLPGIAPGECRPGHVYLVGAGPGDAGLLTLRAARLLGQADAIVYDRLVGDDILALIPPGRERYYVGKARGHHSVAQAEIGTLLVRLAREGKSVVRLKGGDPGVFGRMGEELAALATAEVPARIVPGITAASGAAAAMGLALTDRAHAQQLRFITAQLCREGGTPDWQSLARTDETLVFYMGLAKVAAICEGLRGAGLPDDWPILLISNASLPEQRSLTGTLADMPDKLADAPLPSPCLIVVGSVVGMATAARRQARRVEAS